MVSGKWRITWVEEETLSLIGNIARAGILAFAIAAPGIANAATPFDGNWNLTIFTQRGSCDPTYNFQVQITNGIVSHPNLVRLHGRVRPNGAVSVSVATSDKSANGSGRLTATAGSGRWTGRDVNGRSCSGSWSAQKF
jgi:hypothetical protein